MIASSNQQEILALSTGTILRVSHGWYDHVGLLGEHPTMGERCVLAFSYQAGGFVEQGYSEFARGRVVTVDGYFGILPPETVMRRARWKQGQPYSWTYFNCEHFVRYAHGAPIESPQLRQWTLVLGILGVLTLNTASG